MNTHRPSSSASSLRGHCNMVAVWLGYLSKSRLISFKKRHGLVKLTVISCICMSYSPAHRLSLFHYLYCHPIVPFVRYQPEVFSINTGTGGNVHSLPTYSILHFKGGGYSRHTSFTKNTIASSHLSPVSFYVWCVGTC